MENASVELQLTKCCIPSFLPTHLFRFFMLRCHAGEPKPVGLLASDTHATVRLFWGDGILL